MKICDIPELVGEPKCERPARFTVMNGRGITLDLCAEHYDRMADVLRGWQVTGKHEEAVLEMSRLNPGML
jgi:hypothetical protein